MTTYSRADAHARTCRNLDCPCGDRAEERPDTPSDFDDELASRRTENAESYWRDVVA